MIAKTAFNFLVKNGNGKFVESLLVHTKPRKIPRNIKGLVYKPTLHDKKFPTVLNIKTGKQEQIIIDSIDQISKDGYHFDFSAYNSLGETIGLVRVKDAPNNNILRMLGKEGKDILYVAFSSGLSGTSNAGKMAADELKEIYPERKE
mgnify:CR=1 FL=1